MDIMNELPPEKFEAVDDLLAFVSIYDDENRTRAYMRMLEENHHLIRDKVCLEAGCGFGLFAEKMAQMGASKVYAVEKNPLLFQQAKSRLREYSNIVLVQQDIVDFVPNENVDLLVHEFFGQLLYDEDILSLERLQFTPGLILPDRAVLAGGCIDSSGAVDETVTPSVLEQLKGCLVSGLFDDEELELTFPVISWKAGYPLLTATVDVSDQPGDLLYFGLQIYNGNKMICQAGECDNWSYVWTPRAGHKFNLSFEPSARGMDVYFSWENP